MFDSLYTYLNEGSIYYGLEVCEYPKGEKFHLLKIHRKKQELFIRSEETFDSLESVAETLEKGIPIFLVINTDNVLTKIVATATNANDEALVHHAFPNLDLNDFYYELVKKEKSILISICRKKVITVYLEKLFAFKLDLMGVFLGVSAIASITNYMASDKLSISNRRLFFTDTSIEKIMPLSADDFDTPQQYTINELVVERTYVLGFSSVLAHLMKSVECTGNVQEINTFHKNEFAHKRYFKLLFRASLVMLLSLLFLNFIIFNHYYEKVNYLQNSLAINSANKEQLIQLKSIVKSKESRVNTVLAMSNSNASLFLDEIAKSIPTSILLTELHYQPLKKPVRESKLIEIVKNRIVVSGEVNNSNHFYAWLETMENFTWIDHIETTDYDYSTKNSSNFSIKIFINEQ